MTDNNCNCGCGQTEQMRCINAKSDFDFILRLYDAEHEVIGMPEYDWEAQLYTSSRLNAFIVSSKDGVLTNCWNDNDSIHVVCDNHGLSPGQLFIEFTGYLPNEQYEDGTQKIVLRRSMPIKLMRTNAEPPDTFDMELMFPYIKGDKGDPGQDGKDGQDGKSLTYADMTEEEKNDLAKRIAVDIETSAGTPDLTGYVTEEELQAALDALPTTEIPTHKTINGESIIGEGDIVVEGGAGLTPWQESFLQKQEDAERLGKYSVSLSMSPSSSEFTGEPIGVTLTASGRYDGKSVDVSVSPTSANISGLTFTNGKAETIWNAPSVSTGQVSVSYGVSVGYDDGNGVMAKGANTQQTRYAPMRWVCKPSTDVPTSDEIKGGIKVVKSNPSGDYAIPFTEGDYVWLCFPSFMSPKTFTSGGFTIPTEAAQSAICRIGNTDVSYKCVRVSGAPKTSPMNIKIG